MSFYVAMFELDVVYSSMHNSVTLRYITRTLESLKITLFAD